MGRPIDRGSRPRNASTVDAASTSRLMRGLLDPVGTDAATVQKSDLLAAVARRAGIHLKLDDVLARANQAAAAWAALKGRAQDGVTKVSVAEAEQVAGSFLDVLEELAQVVEDNE